MVRFILDYNHTDFAKANGAAVTGAAVGVPIGDKIDAVSMRAQVVLDGVAALALAGVIWLGEKLPILGGPSFVTQTARPLSTKYLLA